MYGAAILGTGEMGTALARALARGGVSVALGSREPRRAEAAVDGIQRDLGSSSRLAGWDHARAVVAADTIILALDYEHARETVAALGTALVGKVVVDPTTPWGEQIPATSAAEELARLLPPGATLVGAWKTTFAAELRAAQPGEAHDALLCGDDGPSKARVATLVRAIGFRPLDAGGLREARTIEGMCRVMMPILRSIDAPAGCAPAWRFVP